jgi:hypothetical protein
MPLKNISALVTAELDGFTRFSTFRKTATQTTGAGIWYDLSMLPGNPSPNFYIGAANSFTLLKQSTDGGIAHCVNPETKQEYLRTLCLMSASSVMSPLPIWLLDYLGFYPFLDQSVTDVQLLDNTVKLSRYTDGKTVQILPVVTNGQTGGQRFIVIYTNDKGQTGRVTPEHIMNSQSSFGTIITSGGAVQNSTAPFMALQAGDTGVRAIEGVQFLGTGDIGLLCLVLVKPLARHLVRDFQAPYEVDYFQEKSDAPEIKSDAYLNLLCMPNGNISGAILHGYIKTIIA